MIDDGDVPRSVSGTREVAASAEVIFELIADPFHQPQWDGNDNLAETPTGQRVRYVGDVFTMVLTGDKVRDNHVVESRRVVVSRGGPPIRVSDRPVTSCGGSLSPQESRQRR